MAGGLLRARSVHHQNAAVIRSEAEHEFRGYRIVSRENGAHEAATAAPCQRDRIVAVAVRNDGAHRPERLDFVNGSGGIAVAAVKQRWGNEGSLLTISADELCAPRRAAGSRRCAPRRSCILGPRA